MTESDDDEDKTTGLLDVCTWTDDPDEKRRAFILNCYQPSAEFDAKIQIECMEMQFQWLKNGKLPEDKVRKGPKLVAT